MRANRSAARTPALGGATLALALACAAARSARGQEQPAGPEAAEAARALFREGAQRAGERRWAEARALFRRALALRPSPLLRFNLAVASQNAGYLVDALDQYRGFLREDSDPQNAVRRREAQSAVAAIEPVLARVVFRARGAREGDEPRALRIDGRALPAEALGVELPLDPGAHEVRVEGSAGSSAEATVVLGEGERREVTLVLALTLASEPRASSDNAGPSDARERAAREPAAGASDAGASDAGARDDASATGPAPASTVERVRRAIEERAAERDPFGFRRWDRTLVLFGLQGTGTPVGLFALGLRWAARPWFELEPQVGLGHPFGPGLALWVTGRVPWSYQYGTGLTLGVGTNFTEVSPGSTREGCAVGSEPWTPVWLSAGVTNEFRVAPAVALRASAGVRVLANYGPELFRVLTSHCRPLEPVRDAGGVFFDQPWTSREGWPLFPWIALDVGWAL